MEHFKDEVMDRFLHAGIAYIVCRLISGKRAAALYDVSGSKEIDMRKLIRGGFLGEFDERHRDYIPGYASECSYRFASSSGFSIEIFINEKTFILHVCRSSAYFIGNVRGDVVYLYDHTASAHFRFRVSRYVKEPAKKAEEAIDTSHERR